jgi:hypothetical protein
MRYMMLVYTREDLAQSPEETADIARKHGEVIGEATERGIFHGADPLAHTNSAITVRRQAGELLVVDGPFAETKEQLAGYYILDCKSREEAIEWASKIPTECGGGSGSIEIRPFRFQAEAATN